MFRVFGLPSEAWTLEEGWEANVFLICSQWPSGDRVFERNILDITCLLTFLLLYYCRGDIQGESRKFVRHHGMNSNGMASVVHSVNFRLAPWILPLTHLTKNWLIFEIYSLSWPAIADLWARFHISTFPGCGGQWLLVEFKVHGARTRFVKGEVTPR